MPSYSHVLGLHKVRPPESSKPPNNKKENKIVFQWEGILAHFPWDFTYWSVVPFTQQMHDTYTWDIVGKGNKQTVQ